MNWPRLILASASPRRQSILEELGLWFEVHPSKVEEIDPRAGLDWISQNAALKARDISKVMGKDSLVVGADTSVIVAGQALGKPKDHQDLVRMLGLLSNATHDVVTGLCLLSPQWGERVSLTTTQVSFVDISAWIEAYAALEDPYDKAGGYGIQGIAARFVKGVKGSYSNVIGLPIETFASELEALSGKSVYEWIGHGG